MTYPKGHYRNNDQFDVPHHDPQQEYSEYIPSSAFDEAADAILSDDDTLIMDMCAWIEDGGTEWNVDMPWNDRALFIAKLLRDESQEFRDWRDVRHGDEIRNKAIDITMGEQP